MKHLKAFRFRLYPTGAQREYFLKVFGCVRFIYNKMLNDKIEFYKSTGAILNNTPAMYKEEFPWLREVDSLALANAQINLQKAFNNFFRSPKTSFPKFKSKKHSKDSYTTNNQSGSIYINGGHIKLPKIDLIKIKQHRLLPDKSIIKSVTITKEKSNKYYASILAEYELIIQENQLNIENSIGLDYSSHDFYVDNFGNKADYPKFYRKHQDVLAREQRKLSKMLQGSNNYEKQRIRIATIQEKIHSCRLDFLHKLSIKLANNYDYVFVEDINLRGLAQCLKLGKSTNDNSFGEFRTLLKYKMYERGKVFYKIDKWEPTSQTCHLCGYKNSEIKNLSIRSWQCPNCGVSLDRDINAAINIRNAGIIAFSN